MANMAYPEYTWSYSKSDGTRAESEWLWINGAWYYLTVQVTWLLMDGMVLHGMGNITNIILMLMAHYVTNSWHSYNNGKYAYPEYTWSYSKSDGTRAESEWLWINGAWYYLTVQVIMVANGWHGARGMINTNEYYFDVNGHYVTNCWHSFSNGHNHIQPGRILKQMVLGPRMNGYGINGAWYYFDGAGDMVANGWHYAPLNGEYREYYFDVNGHCL